MGPALGQDHAGTVQVGAEDHPALAVILAGVRCAQEGPACAAWGLDLAAASLVAPVVLEARVRLAGDQGCACALAWVRVQDQEQGRAPSVGGLAGAALAVGWPG